MKWILRVYGLLALLAVVSCGIKGPPLPPIEENEAPTKIRASETATSATPKVKVTK